MRKYLLFLIPLFIFSNRHYVAAAETTTKTNDLITNYEQIQAQREVLQQQIKDVEKDINTLSDKEKEKSINENIQLHIKDSKIAAKETAFQKAIELEQPGYIATTTTETTPYSFTPEKLISNIDPPSAYIKYYVEAGKKYNVSWQVLASIHKIETNYSTHPTMISSVGAIGHMQFMPATWAAYGVDSDGDGNRNPWSVQDSIFTAARYLDANGFSKNPRGAIWHYNHADWYVNDVIETAAMIRAS